MKQVFFSLLFIFFCLVQTTYAETDEHWYQTLSRHVTDTWKNGNIELYVPIKTMHMPFAYSHEARENYIEMPLGIGIGKGHYNSSGNYEGMMTMVFQDSHGRPEYVTGYEWIPTWSFQHDIKAGVGMMGFVSARADFYHYMPFPGVLPVGSLTYKKLTLQTTYIPAVGDSFSGNVMFFTLKWTFD